MNRNRPYINSLMLLGALGSIASLCRVPEDVIIIDHTRSIDPPDKPERPPSVGEIAEKLREEEPPQLTKQVQGPPSPYREDYPSRQAWRAANKPWRKS